jgi:hypothetical protein
MLNKELANILMEIVKFHGQSISNKIPHLKHYFLYWIFHLLKFRSLINSMDKNLDLDLGSNKIIKLYQKFKSPNILTIL